jgi:hypothetical protein
MTPSTEEVLRGTIEQQKKIIELLQSRIRSRDARIEHDNKAYNERYSELHDELTKAKKFNRRLLKNFSHKVLVPGAWMTITLLPCCMAFGALWFTAKQGALLGTGLCSLVLLWMGAAWIEARRADLPV